MSTRTSAMGDFRSKAAIGFLAVVPTLFFGRYLLRGQTLAYDDLAYWFFPWKTLLHEMAQQGHISFWLPFEFCGMPHVADIQRQIFYPPNAVFYVLPTDVAMVLFIAGHFVIACLCMFAWLRTLRPTDPIDIPSAMCGALVYGYSAFPLLHLTQLPILASYSWIPGFMLALERGWQSTVEGRRCTRWAAAGGVAFCMMTLGGAPQMVFIACFLGGAYMALLLCTPRDALPQRHSLRAVGVCLAMPLLGAGLAALQLVPTVELLGWSTRQPEVAAAYSSIGTADPSMLWTLVQPYVFGNPADGTWHGDYTFHEECFYVGAVTLLLGVAALVDVRGWRREASARTGFFLIIALLGIVISLGNHVQVGPYGLHDVTRRLLPGFGKFRVPARWMVLTVVGASVLSALGMNVLGRYRSPCDRRTVAALLPLWAAITTAFVLAWLSLFLRTRYQLPTEDALRTLALLTFAVASTIMCRLPSRSTSGKLVLLALVGTDLLAFGGSYVRGDTTPLRSSDLSIVRDMAQNRSIGRIITHTSSDVPTQLATWCAPLGVHNVQGTNPLFLRPFVEYLYYSQTGALPPSSDTGFMHHNGFFVVSPFLSPMTRMLNLTDVIRHERGSSAQWPLSGGHGSVWRGHVDGAMGAVWAVPTFRVVPRREEMLAMLRSERFDPAGTVLLGEDPGFALELPPGKGQSTRMSSRIEAVRPTNDVIGVSATLDRDAILVFSEIFYPGWSCTVDGVRTPILRANDILRGVPVKGGTHHVVMQFRPPSFLIGLLITILTTVLTAILGISSARPPSAAQEA